MSKSIQVLKPATAHNFEEQAYLAANAGVRAAVERGQFESGRHHFEVFGQHEQRKLFDEGRIRQVIALRREKMKRLQPFLDESQPYRVDEETGQIDFMTPEIRQQFNITSTENVSAHDYDQQTIELIDAHAGGLLLDFGSGLRSTYYEDVVNFEIAPFYSTDVSGVGEHLPFSDATFDVVFCLAVLEHVTDPFACAAEIGRVLKPGGTLLSQVPFLHEYHGFPHHYFNMTLQGHRRLFEDDFEIVELTVPWHMWPIKGLGRFLRIYRQSLTGEDRSEFEQMTVREIIDRDFYAHCRHGYAVNLDEKTREVLAGGSVLVGKRKS